MKVVINKEWGGFSLSRAGVLCYTKHKGIAADSTYFDEDEIPRDDPALIATVEELKDKANTMFSCLKIVEIPDGIKWHIEEYDGWEHVAEDHRTWE